MNEDNQNQIFTRNFCEEIYNNKLLIRANNEIVGNLVVETLEEIQKFEGVKKGIKDDILE